LLIQDHDEDDPYTDTENEEKEDERTSANDVDLDVVYRNRELVFNWGAGSEELLRR